MDDLRAILFVADDQKRMEILRKKEILVKNWTINLDPWTPYSHKPPPLSSNDIYGISFHGVPFNLWTPEIIRKLCGHCGEFLSINAHTLDLVEASSIKVKIRNANGPNSIPRVVHLQTPEGDFEIQVNIFPTIKPVYSPSLHRVLIPEVEDEELADDLALPADVYQSEEASSLFKLQRRLSWHRRYCDAFPYATHNTNQRSSHSNSSTGKRKTRKKPKRRRATGMERDKLNGQWRWVPKISNPLGAIPEVQISNSNPKSLSTTDSEVTISQDKYTAFFSKELSTETQSNSNSNSNSNLILNFGSLLPIVISNSSTQRFELPLVEESDSTPCFEQHSTSDIGSSFVPCTVADESEATISQEDYNIQELAKRYLQVGLEVGMSVANQEVQALALFERNIRRDAEALQAIGLSHQNPDLILTQGELALGNDPDSDQEEFSQSIRTPLASFIDPLDSWYESFLQTEFSSDSLSIPPGFGNTNHCSIRSLKATIKNHLKNKKPLLSA